MILNLVPLAAIANADISIDIVYPMESGQQKTSYAPGDNVIITGSSPEKIDLVLRVIDNNNKIIHTDTLLAPDNDGSYEFNFTLPSGPTPGDYDYSVAVGNQDYNSVAVMKVNVPTQTSDHGSSSTQQEEQFDDIFDPLIYIEDVPKAETEEEAIEKIGKATGQFTDEQKEDPELLDKVATIIEATARNLNAQTTRADNNILNVTDGAFDVERLANVGETINAINEAIAQNEIELNRELARELILRVDFDNTTQAKIVIDPKIIQALSDIDVLTITDEEYHFSFLVAELAEQLADEEQLEIYMEVDTFEIVSGKLPLIAGTNLPGNTTRDILASVARTTQSAYRVSFNKDMLQNNVRVSLPASSQQNTQYQAVIRIDGSEEQVVGGRFNSMTGKVDVQINSSGTYVVRENRVDFSDIAHKDAAMQEAIRVLASKGIIEGIGSGQFAPDNNITRAEIAKLFVKTLYAVRGGETFSDIPQNAWYKIYAESARTAGIINGYPGNRFEGSLTISKEQLTAISARTLMEQRRYRVPQDLERHLQFADRNEFPEWALPEISLANREGLIIRRADNRFNGADGITRGDAALILKRLFDRL